jgi:hypothetical protein
MWLWWRRFRNLDRVAVLTEELSAVTLHRDEIAATNSRLQTRLEVVQSARLSAESLASERLRFIDRLEKENDRLVKVNEQILSDRLKSLDAINLKLMEPRTETPPPVDIKQYAAALEATSQQRARHQMVDETRKMHRAMDTAILQKFYPSFAKKAGTEERTPKGPSVNEPGPVVDPTINPEMLA